MRPSRYDLRIYYNPCALDWAKFFIEQEPNANVDEETMFVWFSNAMGAMHNHMLGCAKEVENELSENHKNDNADDV